MTTMMNTLSKVHFFSYQFIVHCLPTISSTLHIGEQEDAHEFLRCMVDALQRSIPPQKNLKHKREYPFSLFTGSVKNTIRCLKCKNLSTRIDPVEDLELEISKVDYSSNLVSYIIILIVFSLPLG